MEFHFIAIDESTYMKDDCQLALFVRGAIPIIDIVGESMKLIPIKVTSTGVDIFESIIKWTSENKLDLSQLSGVVTAFWSNHNFLE